MGLNPVGAWGSMQGFNIVNFSAMYLFGAYLKYNPLEIKRERLVIYILLCIITIFVWSELNVFLTSIHLRSAWVYHNPFVIFLAVLSFLLFNSFNIKSTFINESAKSVYTCFLAHCQVISLISIPIFVQKPTYIMLFHYFIFTVVAYILCWGGWFIYDRITHRMFKSLDKIEISYFK